MRILLEIIIEILCGIAALISAITGIVIALYPAYLMFHVSPWFVLIYITYIIFLIFIYLLIKNK